MANIKSQIKRNRQNETRRVRNKAVRSELKTREKAVFAAIDAGEPTDELLRLAQTRLDSAASSEVYKVQAALSPVRSPPQGSATLRHPASKRAP